MSISFRHVSSVVIIALALVVSALPAVASPWEIEFSPRASVPTASDPPLPEQYDLHMILDDDSAEGALGVTANGAARQFLWFNQFTVPDLPMELTEIWVLFTPGTDVAVGNPVELSVFFDADQNPQNGADLLTSFDTEIQVVDGVTFSVYTLPSAIRIEDFGDILVGVVNRWVESGVSPASQPAALDTSSSQGRSWLAIWTGDPPATPELPADDLVAPVDSFQSGTWMIRAFGNRVTAEQIPVLSPSGIVLMILAGALGGWLLIRRRG